MGSGSAWSQGLGWRGRLAPASDPASTRRLDSGRTGRPSIRSVLGEQLPNLTPPNPLFCAVMAQWVTAVPLLGSVVLARTSRRNSRACSGTDVAAAAHPPKVAASVNGKRPSGTWPDQPSTLETLDLDASAPTEARLLSTRWPEATHDRRRPTHGRRMSADPRSRRPASSPLRSRRSRNSERRDRADRLSLSGNAPTGYRTPEARGRLNAHAGSTRDLGGRPRGARGRGRRLRGALRRTRSSAAGTTTPASCRSSWSPGSSGATRSEWPSRSPGSRSSSSGSILVPLPGPGWLIVFAGLAILATEYVWAQRLLTLREDEGGQAKDVVLRKKQPGTSTRPPEPVARGDILIGTSQLDRPTLIKESDFYPPGRGPPRSACASTPSSSPSSRSTRPTTPLPPSGTPILWIERTPPTLHVQHQGLLAAHQPPHAPRSMHEGPPRDAPGRQADEERTSTGTSSPTRSSTRSGSGSPTR